MLRHYVNPRVPEAWGAQVLLGKAKLPKECFRNSYLERGVSQTPKVSVARESRSADLRSCLQLGGRGVSRPCNCRLLLVSLLYCLPGRGSHNLIWGKAVGQT